MKRLIVHHMCLWLSFLCSLDLAAGVNVGGDIVVSEFKADGTPYHSFTYPFQISVEDEKWIMQVQFGEDAYELSGSDGLKTCTVKCFSEAQFLKGFGLTNVANAKYPATVNGTSYPFTACSAGRVVWLAFASATFLAATNSPELPALWAQSLLDPVANAIKISKVELTDGALKLPSHIEFVLSPQKLIADPTHAPYLSRTILPSAVKRAMEPIKPLENKLVGLYRVLTTTNFEGQVLPLEFELNVLNPGDPSQKLQAYHGTARNITSTNLSTSLPDVSDLKRKCWVEDYRFSDRPRRIDMISYAMADGFWPEANDPMLVAIFQRQQQGIRPVNEGSRRLVLALFILFVAAITFPVALLIINRRRKAQEILNH